MPDRIATKEVVSYREEAISLLEGLVAIPSPSQQEHEASVFLAGWLSRHDFDAHLDKVGNAVGQRGGGHREVLLLGHVDTFPGELPVYRDDDLLYGRGAVDAKSSLCAFASAAALVDVPQGWRVTVVGAVEEELPTSRGARYRTSLKGRPEYCVIGEPSGWDRITLGYKGVLQAKVSLRPPLSHSAGRDRLPAEIAVECWNALVEYCQSVNAGREKEFQRLSPFLRRIMATDEGAYGNIELEAGFRLPLDITTKDLEPVLTQIMASVINGQYELEIVNREEAFIGEKNSPLVRAFLAAIRKQQARPRFVLKTGTTDMNVVGPVWGCPIVAYGPGDSTLDHTPDERIHLDEYWKSIEVLRSALGLLMTQESH
ncbi:MAG: [LysW]-lysine hydrolase [Fidelibacterota bacterium]|nr:MAG: [LysW]-lysine hydrolase [Candidatus Neomarinimicrobiota bacterium]